jgi:hypothetical protein
LASDTNTNALILTKGQKEEILSLYGSDSTTASFCRNGQAYREHSEEDQQAAAVLLATHHLDLESRERPGCRWSIRWSKSSGKGTKATKRELYQW